MFFSSSEIQISVTSCLMLLDAQIMFKQGRSVPSEFLRSFLEKILESQISNPVDMASREAELPSLRGNWNQSWKFNDGDTFEHAVKGVSILFQNIMNLSINSVSAFGPF